MYLAPSKESLAERSRPPFDAGRKLSENELPRSKLRGINPPLADSYGPPVWRGKAGVSCVGSACEP
jgi:hypothetical protein